MVEETQKLRPTVTRGQQENSEQVRWRNAPPQTSSQLLKWELLQQQNFVLTKMVELLGVIEISYMQKHTYTHMFMSPAQTSAQLLCRAVLRRTGPTRAEC